MSSLIVNRSAQIAIRTLNNVRTQVAESQQRIATGLKVQAPKDNPAFFLVATQTRSDVVLTKGIRDNLVIIDNALATSFTGIRAIRRGLDNIRSAVVAGEQAGYDNGLDRVIQDQIDLIASTIRNTQSGDINLLTDGPSLNVVTAITRGAGGNLETQVLTLPSLALDRVAVGVSEGLEVIPADDLFDLSSGGSVIRFGGSYKVTSLTADNITNFNAYRNGPGTADPAPLIPHPSGSNKQWILSDHSDDFRTQNGSGNSVFSGGGNDRLAAGTAGSVLVGGAGNDQINGTRPNSRIFGGDGNDRIRVGRNGSIAVGGPGNDNIDSGNQNEVLFGGLGNDSIQGDGGDDVIIGGGGNDNINAQGGSDDVFEGLNSGSDFIRTSASTTIFYEGNAGQYTVNVLTPTRFTVTENASGDVDDIRGTTPAALVFGVAPPDEPLTPVPSDFVEEARLDFGTLTDPTNGAGAREEASFMALVRLLDPDEPGYNTIGALELLDAAAKKLNFGESQLGSIQKTVQRSQKRADQLTDSLDLGIAALIEADLQEESAFLAAVQVQEQLAADGLQLSNSRASLVLSLFN